jgi:hypothetical protein
VSPSQLARAAAIAALGLPTGPTHALAARLQSRPTRALTLTGCLLSNGYAGYQIEDAVIDAIDGKAAGEKARAGAPAKWILDGGGNLRRRVGEKVQVVGTSDWRADATDEAPGTPHLEVTSVTTLASSCK